MLAVMGIGFVIFLFSIPYLYGIVAAQSRANSSTYAHYEDVERTEKIDVVEGSIQFKRLYAEDGDFGRDEVIYSMKFTLRNNTAEDFTFDVWYVDAVFLDADGFALFGPKKSDIITVPANGTLEYTVVAEVPHEVADQIDTLELRGV